MINKKYSIESVSTLGWDTVYATSFPVLNNIIMQRKSYPSNYNWNDTTGITISGTWLSWQLIPGGAGQDVQMECIVNAGEAKPTQGLGENFNLYGDLSSASIIIQVNLQKIISKDHIIDKTAKDLGQTYQLTVDDKDHGLDPAVSIISAKFPNVKPGILNDVLISIFKRYFNAHIYEFNTTFAVMNINEVADEGNFQWIKPTDFSYAVATSLTGSLDDSVFGLLAMVEGEPIAPDMSQSIDLRSMNSLAPGSNSVFIIGEKLLSMNILRQCASTIIQGSSINDFSLGDDGVSVYNNKDLLWGNFESKNGLISPTIPANFFTVRADDTDILLEIDNAKFSPSDGVEVTLSYSQKLNFDAVQRKKDGGYVFVPHKNGKRIFEVPHVHISVSVSPTMSIVDEILGSIALAAIIIGGISGIGEFFSEAAAVTAETITSVSIEFFADSIEESLDEALTTADGEAAMSEQIQNAAESVMEGLGEETTTFTQKGGFLLSSQFRCYAALIACLTGVSAAAISLVEPITEEIYDDLPTLNTFADNFMGAVEWPGLTNYELVGADLRTSLVFYINMS